MTRIDSLKQQMADAKERMTAINGKAEAEKRIKTAEERTSFDALLLEVQGLERELQDQEAIERIKIEAPAIITSEQKTKNRTFDLGKGVSEFYGKRLTGLEAEIQQELVRNAPEQMRNMYLIDRNLIYKDANKRVETYANSTGLIAEGVKGLDIIGAESILDKIGVTPYPGLTTNLKLNFTESLEADSVAEGVALSAKTWTKKTDTLSPVRYGYTQILSDEAIAVTSVITDAIQDADRVIDVKFAKNIFAAIVADLTCVLDGYSAGTTAAFMTYKKALALKASVLSGAFKNPGYVMGSDLFSCLQGTTGGTIMQTLINDEMKIAGFPAYDAMTAMAVHDSNKYDLIFGDWSRAYAATFGNNILGLLINPYEYDDEGQVKLRFTKLGDVSYNPYAFKVIRNSKIA